MVFNSLFFKEISKNGKKGHGLMFSSAKGKQQSRFESYSVRTKCIDHIPYYLSYCRVHSFCDNLSRNSCIPNSINSIRHTEQYNDLLE